MKRPYKLPSNRPSPNYQQLLMGEARELYCTWVLTRDKALIERHLAKLDKQYRPGAEKRVRELMHAVKRELET